MSRTGDGLGPFIGDALDLIEFANGPATSAWGRRRAEMGHPEPFGLKFLGGLIRTYRVSILNRSRSSSGGSTWSRTNVTVSPFMPK